MGDAMFLPCCFAVSRHQASTAQPSAAPAPHCARAATELTNAEILATVQKTTARERSGDRVVSINGEYTRHRVVHRAKTRAIPADRAHQTRRLPRDRRQRDAREAERSRTRGSRRPARW